MARSLLSRIPGTFLKFSPWKNSRFETRAKQKSSPLVRRLVFFCVQKCNYGILNKCSCPQGCKQLFGMKHCAGERFWDSCWQVERSSAVWPGTCRSTRNNVHPEAPTASLLNWIISPLGGREVLWQIRVKPDRHGSTLPAQFSSCYVLSLTFPGNPGAHQAIGSRKSNIPTTFRCLNTRRQLRRRRVWCNGVSKRF